MDTQDLYQPAAVPPLADRSAVVRQARLAGLLYLVVIVGGLFAEVFVRGSMVVSGDAAATARAIAERESLWRLGVAAHLLYLPAALVVNAILYQLLRPAGATLARLAFAFGIAAPSVEAANLLQLHLPLSMLDADEALVGLRGEQRDALAYLAIRQFSTGFAFSLLIFVGFCVLIGTLILRSAIIPPAIGGLMIVAGACYAVNSLALIMAPELSRALVPWVLLPCLVGELSLASWLAIRGVRAAPPAR